MVFVVGLVWMQASFVCAQATVGTVSPNHSYAAFDVGGNLTDASIYDHAGEIVVIYYYTPW